MTSPTSDVARHLALLVHDVREGVGVDVEPWLAEMPPADALAEAASRTEAEAARGSGFLGLSVSASGRPVRHVGTPLSFLTACWALARAAMPSLPQTADAAVFATERAAQTGRRPVPPFSTGGACRALRAADGWWALSLARPEDVELVPALTGAPVDDPWRQLEQASRLRSVSALVARACELGLPASAAGAEVPTGAARPFRWEWAAVGSRSVGGADGVHRGGRLRVLDLTGLWAGPLCGSLLARGGCDVVKVEAPGRPDGARAGDPRFFDLVNGHKRCAALDLDKDRDALAELVAQADVVLEGSRPESLAARGIHAAEVAARGGVWVRFAAYPTGEVRHGPSRVGFGDDVALGAGLCVAEGADSVLPAGDALADPLTGIAALAALAVTLRAMADGTRTGGCVLEVPMVHAAARAAQVQANGGQVPGAEVRVPTGAATRVQADVAGRLVPASGEDSVALASREVDCRARDLGADTVAVLREWCGPAWPRA